MWGILKYTAYLTVCFVVTFIDLQLIENAKDFFAFLLFLTVEIYVIAIAGYIIVKLIMRSKTN